MKFTEDDIKEIGLAIVGLIILAIVLFYASVYVRKSEDTTVKKPSTTCTEQLAWTQNVCTEKNSALFVGCNGFF